MTKQEIIAELEAITGEVRQSGLEVSAKIQTIGSRELAAVAGQKEDALEDLAQSSGKIMGLLLSMKDKIAEAGP